MAWRNRTKVPRVIHANLNARLTPIAAHRAHSNGLETAEKKILAGEKKPSNIRPIEGDKNSSHLIK